MADPNHRERIIALLAERPMSLLQLRKALGLSHSAHDVQTLSRELIAMHREKLARPRRGGGWEVGPGVGPPARTRRKAAIELQEEANGVQSAPANETKQGEGEVSGGDLDDPAAEADEPARPRKPFAAATLAILEALADGPKTRAQLIELLPDFAEGIDARIWNVKQSGRVVTVGRGRYALAGGEFKMLPVRFPEDVEPELAKAREAMTVDEGDITIRGLADRVARENRAKRDIEQHIGVAGSCDLRAELMTVLRKLVATHDDNALPVQQILELSREIRAIDGGGA